MLKKMLLASGGKKKPIEFVGSYVLGFEGLTTDKVISLTSLTGGVDTQPSAGDIVIVINSAVNGGANAVANLVVDYTSLLVNYAGYSNHYYVASRLSYKIMGSTPDTSLTIDNGTSNIAGAGAVGVLVFRNVDTTTPMDVTPIATELNDTINANPYTITPISSGAFIVCGGAGSHGTGTGIYTSSDLTEFKSAVFNDTYDCTIGIGYKEWVSGAFDAGYFNFSLADNIYYSSIAYSIALRPQ